MENPAAYSDPTLISLVLRKGRRRVLLRRAAAWLVRGFLFGIGLMAALYAVTFASSLIKGI